MTYIPRIHNRKSIRLKTFDYSNGGSFFVTLNAKNSKPLFGEIIKQNIPFQTQIMELNEAGIYAKKCWEEIPIHFPNASIHEFIIMPNHVHGIIEVMFDPNFAMNNQFGKFQSPARNIGSIIRGFKTGVTIWFRQNYPNQYPKEKPIWHRNYYEKIIRNKTDFEIYTKYIMNNPSKYRILPGKQM
jgi:REP element-mobilizing transposase RayT